MPQEGKGQESVESKKTETIAALTSILSPYHKRSAQTLYLNVSRLVNEVPSIGYIAFLTLTFADNVTDHREAYRRYRSWNSHYFAKNDYFGNYINTKEVQTRGAWHYHLLVQLTCDIREGFDFDVYREWLEGNNRFNRRCPTGNASLRALWADLKEHLEPYGLGKIHSLEPVESNAEAISRYVGKYISKHIGNRTEEQKGVRLVNYSRGWLRNSVNFAWNTANAHIWRVCLAKFAKSLGCDELYQLNDRLGPGWAYRYLQDIIYIHQTETERVCRNKSEGLPVVTPVFIDKLVKNTRVRKAARDSFIEGRASLESTDEGKDKVRADLLRAASKKRKETEKARHVVFTAKEGMGAYLDEWRMYAVKYTVEYENSDDVLPFLQVISQLEKVKLLADNGEKFKEQVFVRDGDRAGELVPF